MSDVSPSPVEIHSFRAEGRAELNDAKAESRGNKERNKARIFMALREAAFLQNILSLFNMQSLWETIKELFELLAREEVGQGNDVIDNSVEQGDAEDKEPSMFDRLKNAISEFKEKIENIIEGTIGKVETKLKKAVKDGVISQEHADIFQGALDKAVRKLSGMIADPHQSTNNYLGERMRQIEDPKEFWDVMEAEENLIAEKVEVSVPSVSEMGDETGVNMEMQMPEPTASSLLDEESFDDSSLHKQLTPAPSPQRKVQPKPTFVKDKRELAFHALREALKETLGTVKARGDSTDGLIAAFGSLSVENDLIDHVHQIRNETKDLSVALRDIASVDEHYSSMSYRFN